MDVRAVIEDGVPAAPPADQIGEEPVPVAAWRDGDVAAVLVLSRDDHADEECSGWAQDVDVYVCSNGAWELEGGAGSCWPVAYGDRPSGSLPTPSGFASGHPGYRGVRWLVPCIAPMGVTEVVVFAGGPRQQVTVEPVTGAFLVEADGPEPSLRFELP